MRRVELALKLSTRDSYTYGVYRKYIYYNAILQVHG